MIIVDHEAGSPETPALGGMRGGSISRDGRFVAFLSDADEIIAGLSVGGATQLYLYDVENRSTILVSQDATDSSLPANASIDGPVSISDDGNSIVYSTEASNLVTGFLDGAGPPSTAIDVFLWDRDAGTNHVVSHVPGNPTQSGNHASRSPWISGDGSRVLFFSQASDLVTGFVDNNGVDSADLFAYDIATSTMALVSHSSVDFVTGSSGTVWQAEISVNGGRRRLHGRCDRPHHRFCRQQRFRARPIRFRT